MSFQYYKSKTLNVEPPSGSEPLKSGNYIKTNVQNINDGGIVLRVQFAEFDAIKSVHYFSGSVNSSSPIVQNQIIQLVNQINSPNSTLELTTQADFEAALGEYETFFNSL